MECPTCHYEFDPVGRTECPRCGEPFSCSTIDCGECGACSGFLRAFRNRGGD